MRHLILILLVFGAFSPAHAADNERVFEYRGISYVTKVPNEAPASPAWTPGVGEPPLSVSAAIQLADKEFRKGFATFRSFKFEEIALSKQGEGYMYSVVYLQDISDIKHSEPGPNGEPVMMPLSVVYFITLDGVVRGPEPKSR